VIAARSWSVKGTRIGTSTSLQRKFTHPGDHTLTLTVVDSSGRRSTTSVRITAVR
jgi:membrane carboxypeptidase/penicillin-binding protein PbpC